MRHNVQCKCGMSVSVRGRFVCSCGQQYDSDGAIAGDASVRAVQEIRVSQDIRRARAAACNECRSYKGDRCIYIDLGCKNAYLATIGSQRGMCPLGMWGEVSDCRDDASVGHIVINCDTHGFGDCITAAWISEGSKRHATKVSLHASGEKAKLLRMLGQDVIDCTSNMQSLSPTFPHDQTLLLDPQCGRLESWTRCLGLEAITPSRPTCEISENSLDSMRRFMCGQYAVLCPQSVRSNREWPPVYWLELAGHLRSRGLTVHIVCRNGREFKNDAGYVSDVNWQQIAALLSHALVVVGNDSAPLHLAGLMEIAGLAVLGPTTANVFKHLPSIKCMSADESVIPCTGCWFREPKYQHYPCATGCAALSCLPVRDVLNAVGGMVSTQIRHLGKATR